MATQLATLSMQRCKVNYFELVKNFVKAMSSLAPARSSNVDYLIDVCSTQSEETFADSTARSHEFAADGAIIRKFLISQPISRITNQSNYLLTNENVFKLTRRFPGQIFGIGLVDFSNSMATVREDIERCVEEYGFRGIRAESLLSNPAPRDPYWQYHAFIKCMELNVPLYVDISQTISTLSGLTLLPYLDRIADDFPHLKIIYGHAKFPWIVEAIRSSLRHSNVYLDTSAYPLPRTYPLQLLSFVCSRKGSDRVMLGGGALSLYSLQECATQLRQIGLQETIEEKLLWRNANDVFRLNVMSRTKRSPQKANSYV